MFLISRGLYKWAVTDEKVRAVAMVTVFLICLSVFHHPCQLDHELPSHPLNSTRVITPWVFAISPILFLQMCQSDSGLFLKWLVTFKFSQGEKASSPWFGGPSAAWVLELWGNAIKSSFSASLAAIGNLSMSSPVDPPSDRIPLLLIAWEVCHRSNLSLTLPLDLGENSQGRKLLKLVNALKGKCPSLTWFPYSPFIIGIAPDSAHQVLLHCYSFHPKSSTHHPRLYPYQNSILTLQDSLARILLHRVRGCDPCTLHVNTPLNPTSNFGRSLRLWHPHP